METSVDLVQKQLPTRLSVDVEGCLSQDGAVPICSQTGVDTQTTVVPDMCLLEPTIGRVPRARFWRQNGL